MAITNAMDSSEGTTSCNTVFIDTSIGTHLAIAVSCFETVSDLKKKILREHVLCFPGIEEVQIHALKVERNGYLYHLSDSMLVKCAFEMNNKTWFLSADASSIPIRRIVTPFEAHHPAPSTFMLPLPDGKGSQHLEQKTPFSSPSCHPLVTIPHMTELSSGVRAEFGQGHIDNEKRKNKHKKRKVLGCDEHILGSLDLPMATQHVTDVPRTGSSVARYKNKRNVATRDVPEHCAITLCKPQHDIQGESCKAASLHGNPDVGKVKKRPGASNLAKGSSYSSRRGQRSEDQHDVTAETTRPSLSAHEGAALNERDRPDSGEKRELAEKIPINDEIDLKSKEITTPQLHQKNLYFNEAVENAVLMQRKKKPRKPRDITSKINSSAVTHKSINGDQTSGMNDRETEDVILPVMGTVQQITRKQANPEANQTQQIRSEGQMGKHVALDEAGNEETDGKQESCIVKGKQGKKKTRKLDVHDSSSLRNSECSPKRNKNHGAGQNMQVVDTVAESVGVGHAHGENKKIRGSETSKEANLRSKVADDVRARTERRTPETHTEETATASFRQKGLVEMSDAVFKDTNFGSYSDKGLELDNSGGSTMTPSENSSCSDKSNEESNLDSNLMTTGSYAFKREDIAGASDAKPLCSEMTFDELLRSSSRYKKAKLMASRAEETESQAPDFVPESQG